ncbi:MAG: type II secretion system protein GspG [Zoogloeaceae bacterium]|nr:type II secretion system protein GspG [Zoogloeaceae bacterium]
MAVFLIGGLPRGEETRQTRARDDLRAMRSVLLAGSTLPDAQTGLAALVGEGRLAHLPQDPWGRPYQYRNPAPGRPYDLFSLGADGVESADDISVWNLYGQR